METFASSANEPDMPMVILQNIHRNWENTYREGDASLMEKIDNFNNRWSLVHYAADMNKNAARMAGLMYVDRDIDPDKLYSYKIQAAPGNFFPRESYQMVNNNRPESPPKIYDALGKEKEIHLLWERAYHEKRFSGYFIEKSKDGVSFDRINKVPYVQMFSTDLDDADFIIYKDSVHTEEIHYYRLIGIDAFGDESQPSIILSAASKDVTPPPAPILSIDTQDKHLSATLSWAQPEGEPVTTYHLKRTFGDASYTFQDWADGTLVAKEDKALIEGLYGYQLIAEDSLGNQSLSNEVYVKIHDLEPPMAPTGLSATRNTSGNIILTWEEGKELDIIGYYVYAADGEKRNLTRITDVPHRSRLYIDSLSRNLQNEKRHYQIVAVDNDYMVSTFSEILEVERPDFTPPSPSLINHYEVNQEGIHLHFLPSSSRDVQSHRLRRKMKGIENWETLWTTEESRMSYIDTEVEPSTTYTYTYQAIDDQGNESRVVREVEVSTAAEALPTPQLSGQIIENKISLSWKSENNIKQALIYRSYNQGKPTLLKRVDGKLTQYIDSDTSQGSQYTYYLKFSDEQGRFSRFSEPLNLKL